MAELHFHIFRYETQFTPPVDSHYKEYQCQSKMRLKATDLNRLEFSLQTWNGDPILQGDPKLRLPLSQKIGGFLETGIGVLKILNR